MRIDEKNKNLTEVSDAIKKILHPENEVLHIGDPKLKQEALPTKYLLIRWAHGRPEIVSMPFAELKFAVDAWKAEPQKENYEIVQTITIKE